MNIINGYVIIECFDIDHPNKKLFRAIKKWDDDSFDHFYIYNIPDTITNDKEIFDYIYNICEHRTHNDIIKHQYKIILKYKKGWLKEDLRNIRASFKAWKNKDCTTALDILINTNKSKNIYLEYCKQSLITHLKNITKRRNYHTKGKIETNFLNEIQNIWYDSIEMFFPNTNEESTLEYEIDTYLDI